MPRDLTRLSRPGFTVVLYDTLEEFYLAEALEYVEAWRQSTDDNPNVQFNYFRGGLGTCAVEMH
ncbi:MAG: hypothetical protein A3H96_20495 [Acidobacteria bacterium RIFCSPLOWO2_02_FULL_67_36]|nr:MAG: hypothetical protein A3H96_20495 [Acidobacteria bacterium RIFCSPLOWO2_02_FULL_67_36]OFW20789.1 MAG: hypothetical protein A3G21_22830 [Acidobacteria bacterium RIFCSPLOWO2_12_FULL_66_21]